ncbi:unnamed protein product [Linum trigynum]|uniref:Uncharacterized protein n=1 Tax=Linum trigynum TaxID=586398 RepID=A0AAV2DCJ1_9ROSI
MYYPMGSRDLEEEATFVDSPHVVLDPSTPPLVQGRGDDGHDGDQRGNDHLHLDHTPPATPSVSVHTTSSSSSLGASSPGSNLSGSIGHQQLHFSSSESASSSTSNEASSSCSKFEESIGGSPPPLPILRRSS